MASTAVNASNDKRAGQHLVTSAPVKRDGDWIGTLTLPSRATLRIAAHLRVDRDGMMRGSFDSLDQSVWNVPLDAVTMTATTLDFTVPSNGTRYAGRWDVQTRRWVGVWSQGGTQFTLTLAGNGPQRRRTRGRCRPIARSARYSIDALRSVPARRSLWE
ncbi:hypothetical protein [Sphingomonas faeni]|nr:hypothetical protein [Sphingomonas faeni]